MFGHMHGVLNKIYLQNFLHGWIVNREMNLIRLINPWLFHLQNRILLFHVLNKIYLQNFLHGWIVNHEMNLISLINSWLILLVFGMKLES